MNYKFVIHQNPNNLGTEVIAVSRFAGRPVRGKAICAPDDEFNEDKGMALAKARCDAKVAALRKKRAFKKWNEAQKGLLEATNHYEDMKDYLVNAEAALLEAEATVKSLLEDLAD